ncbi:hypothetical protein GALMADRAFT_220257 [Galerina marginata CBS 339.88]|uniref:Uncharacterized protein n=1 Tax=Galerina marginata (strain CBS 339.88) TaxID=685588 RepID=A0A067TQG1_GALM3|nr:hypothetical protein GALMADRAFT_220257 [Galerina marginata CBS 339.88]
MAPYYSNWLISVEVIPCLHHLELIPQKLCNDVIHDSELWGDRGQLYSTVSIVKSLGALEEYLLPDTRNPLPWNRVLPERYNFLPKNFGEGEAHAPEQICRP